MVYFCNSVFCILNLFSVMSSSKRSRTSLQGDHFICDMKSQELFHSFPGIYHVKIQKKSGRFWVNNL